jgi:glycosyltransferase involved in cell wall biosynthesis
MLGFVDRRAAAQLLDWTDYVLIPSRLESIPLIFSDAMQAHRPVICTPTGDLPSLLDQYRVGVLAPEVDMNAFVAALRSGLSLNPTSFGSEFERACGDFDVSVRVHRLLSWLDEAPSPS